MIVDGQIRGKPSARPSRQPLRGFLRMRTFLNVINDIPHAEERLKGASRSTHNIDAAPRSLPSAILSQARWSVYNNNARHPAQFVAKGSNAQ
jgi:hypothetical protein